MVKKRDNTEISSRSKTSDVKEYFALFRVYALASVAGHQTQIIQ